MRQSKSSKQREGLHWLRTAVVLLAVLALGYRVVLIANRALMAARPVQSGEGLNSPDPQERLRVLGQRLLSDPADQAVLLALWREWSAAGQGGLARRALTLSRTLAPVDPAVLRASREAAQASGDAATADAILEQLLEIEHDLSAEEWQAWVADWLTGAARGQLSSAARLGKPWWHVYFAHACALLQSVEQLRALDASRTARVPPAPEESACFIRRLLKEGLWSEAETTWRQRFAGPAASASLLPNGDFSGGPDASGLDWQWHESDGVAVTRESVGADTRSSGPALKVVYAGQRYQGPPVERVLVLPPGAYDLSGWQSASLDQTWRGLVWAVHCIPAAGQVAPDSLAQSEAVHSSLPRSEFKVSFFVPQHDCPAQSLRLELERDASQENLPVRLHGNLWFQSMRLMPQY